MRGRRRIVALAVSLALLVGVPLAFGLGIVDIPLLPWGSPSSTGEPLSSSAASVFVDPTAVIKDYLNDPGYQVGDKFTVHVNVSDATDLFAWQVNLTWNPSILNFSRVKEYGPFLRATASPNGTSGWIDRDPTQNVTIAPYNNTVGYVAIAETILGDYSGISGTGRLVSVEFEVVGYGCTNLTIGTDGTLATTLLNSTQNSVTVTPTNGWFSNKLAGDANGDGYVNALDVGKVNAHWAPAGGPPGWSLGYARGVDNNDDGYINALDIGVVNANWGRTIY